jgi:hypothetical protein
VEEVAEEEEEEEEESRSGEIECILNHRQL